MPVFHRIPHVLVLLSALAVTACASDSAVSSKGVYDPHEAENRGTHQFNKDVDTYVVSPLSDGYGTAIPEGVRDGVSRFSSHLGLPNDIFNNLFQGDLDTAAQNTGRFLLNTVVGFGGVFDPASDVGLERVEADFGQTLHVWGAAEGPYVEMPFFGPSTSRDVVGFGVDLVLDPFFVVARDPQRYIGAIAYIVDSFGKRYKYDATIDSILYESEDSYVQARSLYLQNRRYELGLDATDLYVDVYEDLYEDF